MRVARPFPVLLEKFFADRLIRQRQASPHTIAAYRDTFRLLLSYAHSQLKKAPSALGIEDLDAPFIGRFLENLEMERGVTARSRNLRLAAIRSFYRYVSFEEPALAAHIQRILAIPSKRYDRALVDYLTPDETRALLEAPDRNTWAGRRDAVLLAMTVLTGLRVSEVTALRCQDVALGVGAHVRCYGKGRKERTTPLTKSVARSLAKWMEERAGCPGDPLFPSARGATLSTDGVQYLLSKHVATATRLAPSLAKKRVSPHVLRHTAAMNLLENGVDRAMIALWLGHESVETTQMYLDASLALKEAALSKASDVGATVGRFRPDDHLMAFLKGL